MKNIMIIMLLNFMCLSSFGLIPIDGLILGEVDEIKQFDPFEEVLTKTSSIPNKADKLKSYIGLYKQGVNLKNTCDRTVAGVYSSNWKETTAKRSVIATLQYIGLDKTLKGIAAYAKKLEMPRDDFTNLYKNLVINTCSQNLSVYSKTLLLNNFKKQFDEADLSILPSVKGNKQFFSQLQKYQDTRETITNELEYTIMNFRSLCAWDGDTNNLTLLKPYLSNPFLMSYIFNHIAQKKIVFEPKTKSSYFAKDENTSQVLCENLICRKTQASDFNDKFARQNGSISIQKDLETMYCHHFVNAKPKKDLLSERVRAWIDDSTHANRKIEAMNLVALFTKVPDLFITADSYEQVLSFFTGNIKDKWNRWANNAASNLNMDQLYEEQLEVSLVSQGNLISNLSDKLSLKFNIELGEIDKMLGSFDKIKSEFNLVFPEHYLTNLQKSITFNYNTDRYEELKKIKAVLQQNISFQLEKKKKFFKVPVWNERMPGIMADEIIAQLLNSKRLTYSKFTQKERKIPVEFRFGVFALQYIRDKYIFRYKDAKLLTFK